ncbi:hypothetical protein M422DRAFT_45126 [Sphaerobolus stellatus SS14]|nr:hypothetical protein M422DRAFT_45126 [Sphaerobolus stellatus SS14]
MTRLVRFSLTTMQNETPRDYALLDEVVSAVAKAPFRLQELSLTNNCFARPHAVPKTPHLTPILSTLKGLCLSKCTCRYCYATPFHIALVSTPELSLQDVSIVLSQWPFPGIEDGTLQIADLFGRIYWPQLRRFTLSSHTAHTAQTDSHKESLKAFIIRHTKLEALCLDGIPLPDLPPNALPRLDSLEFDWSGKQHTYRLPQPIARNIRHFKPKVEGDQMLDVLKDMNELRSCQLSGISDISKLLKISKHVEQLSYKQPGHPPSESGQKINATAKQKIETATKQRIKKLAAFKHLTHLGEFFECQALEVNSPASRQTNILRELVDSIRTLNYVEICRKGHPEWVCVERDEGGRYSGFHASPTNSWDGADSEENPRPETWGNFYRGFTR